MSARFTRKSSGSLITGSKGREGASLWSTLADSTVVVELPDLGSICGVGKDGSDSVGGAGGHEGDEVRSHMSFSLATSVVETKQIILSQRWNSLLTQSEVLNV